MMPSENKTEAMRLIQAIDKQVNQLYSQEGEEAFSSVLLRFRDDIPFIMKTLTHEELDSCAEHYKGFYKLMTFLQHLAQEIQAGNIKVPQTH